MLEADGGLTSPVFRWEVAQLCEAAIPGEMTENGAVCPAPGPQVHTGARRQA